MKFNKGWVAFGVASLVTIVSFFVLEFWAILDGDVNTWTLTWTVVNYVPEWVTFLAIGGIGSLAVWLFFHFKKYYS